MSRAATWLAPRTCSAPDPPPPEKARSGEVRRIGREGNHVFHTAFSGDGRQYPGGGDRGTLRVREVSSGRQVREMPVTVGPFLPGGRYAAAGSHRGRADMGRLPR